MKLRYMSDTHNEGNGHFKLKNNGEDILVLAGDITTPNTLKTPQGIDFFKQLADEFPEIVYVLGNHELYRWKDPNTKDWVYFIRDKLKDIPNLHILDDELVTINGWRIAGATLWTDFDGSYPLKVTAPQYMRDYAWGLTVEQVEIWHRNSVNFLHNSAADIVVTHHAPTSHTVSPKYEGNYFNPYFHSNLDELLQHVHPLAWIHGHMHHKAKVLVGDTIIALNPKGYKNENPEFNILESLEWN